MQAHKTCITQASLDKTLDFGPAERDCRRTRDSRSARGWQVQQDCRVGGSKQTMNIRYDVVNRETTKGIVDITMYDGQTSSP